MTTQEIRTKANGIIKSFGLNQKDVSLSVTATISCIAVKVKAKHLNIPFSELEKALNVLSVVDYCQASGEILEGGNTYVILTDPEGYRRNWN